jgi:2-methylcitrate dehydratase PrpD
MSVCNIEEPKTALEAKFSLRGVAAMTLLGDDTRDVGAYSPERIQRVEITAMLRRINVVARDDISGGTSIAIVNTTDGREIKLTSDTYKPIDDMRLKEDVVVRKFLSLIQPILGVNGALALKEGVMNINPEDTIQQILNLI